MSGRDFILRWSVALAAVVAVAAAASPAAAVTAAPSASPTAVCVPPNGTVHSVSGTTIVFSVPVSSCLPQAIFNVSLYRSAEDAAAYRNRVASGTGSRVTGVVQVSGLTPLTEYWYRFDGAVVAGPVRTTSSSASPSPSPSMTMPPPPPPRCHAVYRVLSRWPGGFHVEVTVTALQGPQDSWMLRWHEPGQTIAHAWGAVVTTFEDGFVVARNADWNGTLAAGASTTMGFIGGGTTGDWVPGVACS